MCEVVSALALDKLLASPSVLQLRMMVYDSLRSILVVLRLLLFSILQAMRPKEWAFFG
jgi:hypothetical protein